MRQAGYGGHHKIFPVDYGNQHWGMAQDGNLIIAHFCNHSVPDPHVYHAIVDGDELVYPDLMEATDPRLKSRKRRALRLAWVEWGDENSIVSGTLKQGASPTQRRNADGDLIGGVTVNTKRRTADPDLTISGQITCHDCNDTGRIINGKWVPGCTLN